MYDYTIEPDEPDAYSSTDANEIYHDDQFFKESEAIPPAPKVHGGLAAFGTTNATIGHPNGIKHNSENFDDMMFEGNFLHFCPISCED